VSSRKLPWGQAVEPYWTNTQAVDLSHEEAATLESVTDFTVLSFLQDEMNPPRPFDFIATGLDRSSPDRLILWTNSLRKSSGMGFFGLDFVLFLDFFGRVKDFLGKITVIGKKNQTRGHIIQSADIVNPMGNQVTASRVDG
jgi:hypothetical protein